jgi:hypothetical protein
MNFYWGNNRDHREDWIIPVPTAKRLDAFHKWVKDVKDEMKVSPWRIGSASGGTPDLTPYAKGMHS